MRYTNVALSCSRIVARVWDSTSPNLGIFQAHHHWASAHTILIVACIPTSHVLGARRLRSCSNLPLMHLMHMPPPPKKKKDNCTTTDQLWTKKTPWLNNSMAFPHSASSLIGSRAADALPPLLAGAFSGESCLQTMLHIGPDLQRIQQPNNIYIYFYIIIKHDCTCST